MLQLLVNEESRAHCWNDVACLASWNVLVSKNTDLSSSGDASTGLQGNGLSALGQAASAVTAQLQSHSYPDTASAALLTATQEGC